jgi:hypothetical protein
MRNRFFTVVPSGRHTFGEQPADYRIGRIDTDTDSDPDADKP